MSEKEEVYGEQKGDDLPLESRLKHTHTHTHIMNCLAHSPRKKRFSLSVLAAANHRPFPPSVSVLFHCFHVTPSTNGRPRTRRTLANQRPVAMSEAESIRESSPSFPPFCRGSHYSWFIGWKQDCVACQATYTQRYELLHIRWAGFPFNSYPHSRK